ncbi:CCHC-type zinc finger protein CG3800-like [Papaver somniferum]|uniref:CCHC-type zinc finger protein CG3800-like n=1 Tax=Papaver somniferum TaxID=3469 RepID=UPI000E6F66CC|nr:CCHC-type zinc finger protein CG3800-like [Papaver somniferum]
MGGGSSSLDSEVKDESSNETTCQICFQSTHSTIDCPFIYSKCRKCDGIRRVWEGNTQANPQRRFLRCQNFICGEFQWMDEAVRFPPPRQHQAKGCSKCHNLSHWAKNCPEGNMKQKQISANTSIGELCDQFQISVKLDIGQKKRNSM